MANLEFQFNQAQLNTIINKTPTGNNIHVSIFSFHEPGASVGEIYLAAQSCDPITHAPDTNFMPPVACPVPPGWGAGDAIPNISHSDLEKCPKFILKAADKLTVLTNAFPQPAGSELVTVMLEGTIVSPNLFINASFKIKNNTGTITGSKEAGVK